MSDPLPPLGLDDLRVTEPGCDDEAEFDAAATWSAACHWQDGAISQGYTPDAVAAVLMTLEADELADLRDWWQGECDSVAQEGQGRDALCHDLPLCAALDRLHPLHWPLPMIDPATVLDLMNERDRLRAALLMIYKHAVQGVMQRRFAADQCHEIAGHASKALEG